MKRSFPAVGAASVAAAWLLSTSPAGAQSTASGFALDRFNPSERGSEWFALDSLDLRGQARPAIGARGRARRQSARHLQRRRVDRATTPVQYQLILHPGRVARALGPPARGLRPPDRRLPERATPARSAASRTPAYDLGGHRRPAPRRRRAAPGPVRRRVPPRGRGAGLRAHRQPVGLPERRQRARSSSRACRPRATSASSATRRTSASTTAT